MKVDLYPVTDAQKKAADEDHARRRAINQNYLKTIASKLESGESLNSLERQYAASALRHVATLIPEKRPKPNKRPPKVPGDAAVLVAVRVVSGMDKAAAMDEVSLLFDISDRSTMEKAIKRQGYEEIERSLRAMNQKK